jgi:POT family proton-dependent oligopeptide transporter
MTAVGNFLAGKIGEATGGHGGEMTKESFLDIYTLFGWITIGIGVAVLLVSPFVRRLMHLDTLKDEDLAGRAELAENQGPGMFPQGETVPGRSPKGA